MWCNIKTIRCPSNNALMISCAITMLLNEKSRKQKAIFVFAIDLEIYLFIMVYITETIRCPSNNAFNDISWSIYLRITITVVCPLLLLFM